MAKRPAEAIVAGIQRFDKRSKIGVNSRGTEIVIVPVIELRRWLKLALSIDARMRLDGSKLNKRKRAAAK